MDQKHAMLYPPVDFNTTNTTNSIQEPATVPALPVEAPPSYDVAISGTAPPRSPSPPTIVVTGQPLPTHQQLPIQPTFVPTGPTHLGPNPCSARCPACGAQRTTRMTHTANNRTHLGAAILCLVGWCCCACFVPYCMNSCRTGNHYCAKCNTFLGTYSPRGLR